MKNIFLIVIAALMLTAIFPSCEKDIPTGASIEAYDFASLDLEGGNWQTVLLDSASQIGIPAPADVASSEYQSELADLKAASANLTSEQEEAVRYWGNNPIVRWNEIARELAAKYNLPASPDTAGNYPGADPANPGKYPNFPFAHPPYSCRMFAYWSAAQFDALISAWHYKQQFNRPAPYKTDATVTTHLPQNDLPAYPSDGAVVAGVSKSILTAMFPLEKDFIAEKATEHLNSLQWAGINVESDIVWGDSLGRGVAAKFKARAASDGMKSAQTPRPVSDSLRDAAQAQFGWHWENLETPPRPVGITPYFGRVKPWFIADIKSVRPGPPPAPGSAEFEQDANELRELLDNPTNEQRKIANFWSDGLGTYTPPGHWNRFAVDLMVENRYNPLRSARTFAYLNMAVMNAGISCWDTKYFYHYPRPIQAMPGFKTILGTPNFPSYTSGHSTFSAAGATVLSYFFPEDAAQLDQRAHEASDSRLYGGIHYRFDTQAGWDAGTAIGNLMLDVAKVDGAE